VQFLNPGGAENSLGRGRYGRGCPFPQNSFAVFRRPPNPPPKAAPKRAAKKNKKGIGFWGFPSFPFGRAPFPAAPFAVFHKNPGFFPTKKSRKNGSPSPTEKNSSESTSPAAPPGRTRDQRPFSQAHWPLSRWEKFFFPPLTESAPLELWQKRIKTLFGGRRATEKMRYTASPAPEEKRGGGPFFGAKP